MTEKCDTTEFQIDYGYADDFIELTPTNLGAAMIWYYCCPPLPPRSTEVIKTEEAISRARVKPQKKGV